MAVGQTPGRQSSASQIGTTQPAYRIAGQFSNGTALAGTPGGSGDPGLAPVSYPDRFCGLPVVSRMMYSFDPSAAGAYSTLAEPFAIPCRSTSRFFRPPSPCSRMALSLTQGRRRDATPTFRSSGFLRAAPETWGKYPDQIKRRFGGLRDLVGRLPPRT